MFKTILYIFIFYSLAIAIERQDIIDVLENFAEILHPQLFAGLPMVNLYTKFE